MRWAQGDLLGLNIVAEAVDYLQSSYSKRKVVVQIPDMLLPVTPSKMTDRKSVV